MAIPVGALRTWLLVRRLYEQSARTPASPDEVTLIAGTIILDLAVETALHAVLLHAPADAQQPRLRDRATRHELWTAANQVMQSSNTQLLHHHSLARLHAVRNSAQHGGIPPPADTLQRHVPEVHATLVHACRTLTGADFDLLCDWDVVANKELRELLQSAEQSLREGDFAGCVHHCAVASEAICAGLSTTSPYRRRAQAHLRSIPDEVRRGLGDLDRSVSGPVHKVLRIVKGAIDYLGARIDHLGHEALLVGIGMPVLAVRDFERVAQWVRFSHGAIIPFASRDGVKIDEESARLALRYLAQLVSLVAERYPEVLAEAGE